MAKKHVFLSYCRDNANEVNRLHGELLAAGEPVWWDQDILPGQDWKLEIRKAMKDAYAVLLCLSKETGERTTSGIYPEALDAIKVYRNYAPGSIFLIPVRLSECDIPMIEIDDTRTLSRLQRVDLFPADQ
ncbi:MAG: toll/interleukin-1 receptor domain-containing protein [Cyanobacteria bacterium P01_F01_bin.13]